MFSNLSFTRILTRVFIVLSFAVSTATAYFIINLDVLEYWHVKATPVEVHAGEVVYAKTSYNKVRPVSGIARRYVECKASNGGFISYLINEVPADKTTGIGGRTIELPTPRGITKLPTTCRVRISAEYQVLPFKTVLESTISNEFKLLPEKEEDRIRREQGNGNVSAPQSTASPAQSLAQSTSSSSSYPDSTPTPQSESVTNDTFSSEVDRQETPLTGVPLVDNIIRGIINP